ncbi:MAG: hypothetical protein M0Z59_06445 [Nitrospiraceae bacterium]|nr:hypothetical protein [Nitrospiraceae bacterium]
MLIKYLLYFLIGGSVISVVTYFASHARGLVAAFLANMPLMTLITFLTIYYETGPGPVVIYAKGLVLMLVPWLAYIFAVIFLTPRAGVVASLLTGLVLYFALALVIILFKRFFF